MSPKDCTVETLYDRTGKRRVRIVALESGSFTFEEEYFSDEPRERCWLSAARHLSLCDSIETARREARGRVAWFRLQEP
jgi:hypothetical protein